MDSELRELKHEPKPGFGKVFTIAFAVMALYLALILLTSSGPAETSAHPDSTPSH